MKNRYKSKNTVSNRLAIVGITIVVMFIAFAMHVRSVTLKEQDREYQLQEESLQADIDAQKQLSEELEQKKIYVVGNQKNVLIFLETMSIFFK